MSSFAAASLIGYHLKGRLDFDIDTAMLPIPTAEDKKIQPESKRNLLSDTARAFAKALREAGFLPYDPRHANATPWPLAEYPPGARRSPRTGRKDGGRDE